MSSDINVTALTKGRERYVFICDNSNRAKILQILGRCASNPELSFTWCDAAILSQKIHHETHKFRAKESRSSVTPHNRFLQAD